MIPSACHAQRHNPQLYLQLGELIASTGKDSFAEQMLTLVEAQVPVHRLDLSEWTLDAHQLSVNRVKVLGGAGLHRELPPHDPSSHPLLEAIKRMKAPLLIQLKAAPGSAHPQHNTHQCNLVSGSGDRRWVICFHRLSSQSGFSLSELSLLKNLSDTLLPLLEQHAADACELSPASLRHDFGKRLAQEEVQLSTREQEVCLGLLTGGTVAQLAQRLNVKNSSVETYLKRATAKLGVSGRHGLARWMAEA